MPERIEDMFMTRPATADRPLLGQTVLVVEDSRFASEALRLMCLRSGARVRRADSLRTAARHLATYHPSIVVIDLVLPDGSGIELIAELDKAQPRIGLILATSGEDSLRDDALAAGADGFLEKPQASLSLFQNTVLDLMPAEFRPKGVRLVADDRVAPDRIAFQDDLVQAASVLERTRDEDALAYLGQFISGVARSAEDHALEEAARALAARAAQGGETKRFAARVACLVDDRLRARSVL